MLFHIGLDAWWAGVPSVALGGGAMMPARAAESFAEAMNSYTGIAWSLKGMCSNILTKNICGVI